MGTVAHDPLSLYCFDLVSSSEHAQHPRTGTYAEETARALAILARRHDPNARVLRKTANPVWVDADGAERTAVMQEAVAMWSNGEVPSALRGQRLLGLDFDAIMEGVDVRTINEWSASMRARYPHTYYIEELDRDLELAATHRLHVQERQDWLQANTAYQRLIAVLYALRDTLDTRTPAILYVDHIHRLLGGGGERYPFDLTSVLKPLLHRRRIQLWGACTLIEYWNTIEHDASMARCFAAVKLPSARASQSLTPG